VFLSNTISKEIGRKSRQSFAHLLNGWTKTSEVQNEKIALNLKTEILLIWLGSYLVSAYFAASWATCLTTSSRGGDVVTKNQRHQVEKTKCNNTNNFSYLAAREIQPGIPKCSTCRKVESPGRIGGRTSSWIHSHSHECTQGQRGFNKGKIRDESSMDSPIKLDVAYLYKKITNVMENIYRSHKLEEVSNATDRKLSKWVKSFHRAHYALASQSGESFECITYEMSEENHKINYWWSWPCCWWPITWCAELNVDDDGWFRTQICTKKKRENMNF